jgi:hypothetical protein
MKKLSLLGIVIILCYFIISSCNKDKINNNTTLDCTIVDSTNTYDLRIKSIMDINCATAGCHNTTSASATVILDNYNSTKDALATKNVLCAMKYETNCIPMPPSGKLNDTIINYINCWKEAGYPR